MKTPTQKYLALVDALDAAKRACDERRHFWERTQGPRSFTYDPVGAQLKADMHRASAALKRGKLEFDTSDPRVEDMRALVRAELEHARDAFERLAADPPKLANATDVRSHADELERFFDRDTQIEKIKRRLRAVYAAAKAGHELVSAERTDRRLPVVPRVTPSFSKLAPTACPSNYMQVCEALAVLDEANKFAKDPGDLDEVNARECEAGIVAWRNANPDEAEHLDRVEAALRVQAAE